MKKLRYNLYLSSGEKAQNKDNNNLYVDAEMDGDKLVFINSIEDRDGTVKVNPEAVFGEYPPIVKYNNDTGFAVAFDQYNFSNNKLHLEIYPIMGKWLSQPAVIVTGDKCSLHIFIPKGTTGKDIDDNLITVKKDIDFVADNISYSDIVNAACVFDCTTYIGDPLEYIDVVPANEQN